MFILRNCFFGLAMASCAVAYGQPSRTSRNPLIDYPGFVRMAEEFAPLRDKRRINIEEFVKMLEEPNTIILDTRSRKAFNMVHMTGAIHLNFSDFSSKSLAEAIPSKETRILIYCNNNFLQPGQSLEKNEFIFANGQRIQVRNNILDPKTLQDEEVIISGTTTKSPPLALNIPTFINLFGYGYENVFELADVLSLDDPRLKLEGHEMKKPAVIHARKVAAWLAKQQAENLR